MKFYWDSSAVVAAALDDRVRERLASAEAVTRTHSLAEVFSTLTGSRLGFRVDANDATRLIRELRAELSMIDLSGDELIDAWGKRGRAEFVAAESTTICTPWRPGRRNARLS